MSLWRSDKFLLTLSLYMYSKQPVIVSSSGNATSQYQNYIGLQSAKECKAWYEGELKRSFRPTMMQWSNLTKFFNISRAIHTLFHWWYRNSHPDPRKSPQLQIWPHHRSDTTSQPSVSPCWGTENSQMVPNQENMEGDQPEKPESRTAAIATTDLCGGALSWWNRIHFVSFPSRFEMSLVSTTFQSPELLIQCGFIWKETMQLVSGKVEFNPCQVSLLWHNFFLVSLHTFQPTLIHQATLTWIFHVISTTIVMYLCAHWKLKMLFCIKVTNTYLHVGLGLDVVQL